MACIDQSLFENVQMTVHPKRPQQSEYGQEESSADKHRVDLVVEEHQAEIHKFGFRWSRERKRKRVDVIIYGAKIEVEGREGKDRQWMMGLEKYDYVLDHN